MLDLTVNGSSQRFLYGEREREREGEMERDGESAGVRERERQTCVLRVRV